MFFFAALLSATGALAGEFERDRQSAEAGDLVAAYNLAVAYRDGIGTAVDGQQAIAWFGVIFDDGGDAEIGPVTLGAIEKHYAAR